MTRPAERPDEEALAVAPRGLRRLRPGELLLRFGFGAAVSALAASVALSGGPRLGGLYLAFPAILPATLTLLEKKEGLAQAVSDIRGATIGSIGLLAFAAVAANLLTRSPGGGLAAALAAWLLVSLGVYAGLRMVAAAVGERQYLPEIPTVEAQSVITGLRAHEVTLGVAESCTGGTVSALLTSVPGTGDVVRGALVTWADGMKTECLGVDPRLIAEAGTVSPEVAGEMARQAKCVLRADVGLAVTGIEGEPSEGQPPGLTYVAVALPDGSVAVSRHAHDQGAGRNRERDVRMAFDLLRRSLDEVVPKNRGDVSRSASRGHGG
jgi:PncC family amidohydrolase